MATLSASLLDLLGADAVAVAAGYVEQWAVMSVVYNRTAAMPPPPILGRTGTASVIIHRTGAVVVLQVRVAYWLGAVTSTTSGVKDLVTLFQQRWRL